MRWMRASTPSLGPSARKKPDRTFWSYESDIIVRLWEHAPIDELADWLVGHEVLDSEQVDIVAEIIRRLGERKKSGTRRAKSDDNGWLPPRVQIRSAKDE